MEINIKSSWATALVSKMLTKAVRNKLGRDASVQVNSVSLCPIGDTKLKLHVDIDACITKEDLTKLLLG